MMIANPIYYFITIILLFNIVFLVFHKNISSYFQLYDEVDNKRKIHKERVAITGGIYIFINIILLCISQVMLESFFALNFPKQSFYSLAGIFSASSLLFLGVYDDKYEMLPFSKFLLSAVILSGFVIIDQGHHIRFIKFDFLSLEFNIYKYRYVLTILCFMLFLNSCNMFDGINGQSTFYFIFLLIYIQIVSGISLFLIILIISLIIFLFLNFNNKSFLGDGGIYLLSFILASIIIKKYHENYLFADQIFLLMLIPGIDMFRLFIQRVLNKQNPFLADSKHIHHLFLKKFSARNTFIIIQLLIIIPNIVALIFNAYMLILILSVIVYLLLLNFLHDYSKKN